MEKRRKVVVFGIFDGLHAGHHFFFEQARKYGDKLIVIAGRDDFVRNVKNKEPRHSEQERIRNLLKEPFVDNAVLGDKVMSSYRVLEDIQPDSICFGYDQKALSEDVKKWMEKNGMHIPTYSLRKL